MPEPHPITALYAAHINPAFVRVLGTLGYGRVFERARGMSLWDSEGREYLDFLAGFGAVNLGHQPPRVVAALEVALRAELPNVLHVGPQPAAARLGAALAARIPELPRVVFASSGGEAVEAAMKIARVATGRAGVLACDGGFHGTGFGALSVMGADRMRAPFEPLLPGCGRVPFGDLDALERRLASGDYSAFVVEPIQAEGGVRVPPPGYLAEVKRLCAAKGTLMILDEVQTGIGRTGCDFAFRHETEAVPDLLVLGKSLGGSLLPISAVLASRALHDRVFSSMETFDLCSSTFGGNALACHAALATLETLETDELATAAAREGEYLITRLRAALSGHPFVRDVRGRGLLVGIELGPTSRGLLGRVAPGVVSEVSEKVFGQWLAVRLLEAGIVTQPASQRWDVLRLEPPLIVRRSEIDRVVDAITTVLDDYRSLPALVADVATRLGVQAARRRSFR